MNEIAPSAKILYETYKTNKRLLNFLEASGTIDISKPIDSKVLEKALKEMEFRVFPEPMSYVKLSETNKKNLLEIGTVKEFFEKNPMKAKEVLNRWEEFLGTEPYTNVHPRTGLPDPDRIFSADGKRSIRFGKHEINSSLEKFHYHEEIWDIDLTENKVNVQNKVVRIQK